jgi:surface carbohydrate biosynthesis protein
MNYLLPIETINRELDFKLILAAKLANRKNIIWIGQHDYLNEIASKIQGGIYIGKNVFTKKSSDENGEKYYYLKKRGFSIIYLHEEGAVFVGKSEDWKKVLQSQYNIDFFDQEDRICVWGNFQNDYDKNRSRNVPIITTGHPRFDLYKQEYRWIYNESSKTLKSKYSKYILINGNYSTSNHGLGLSRVFSELGNYYVEDFKSRIKKVDFFTYSTIQRAEIIKLIHHLSVYFPEITFVFRPHPSENHETYKIIFEGIKNVIVNHEGPVGPWILGADAIIHDGCTTAIEAAIAGIPVINYKPHFDIDLDIWLPNQMGVKLESINEVIVYLEEIISGRKSECSINNIEKVSELFDNFNGNSFEKLIRVIKEVEKEKGVIQNVNLEELRIKWLYLKFDSKRKLYSLKDNISKSKFNYHNGKFYGFYKHDIQSKFRLIKENVNSQIHFKIHNPYLIEVK